MPPRCWKLTEFMKAKHIQGYGKRQAEKYGSAAAYKEARAEAKAAWKKAEAGSAESLLKRQAALEAEKKALTVSLRKEARTVTKARGTAAKIPDKIPAKIEGIDEVVVRVVGERRQSGNSCSRRFRSSTSFRRSGTSSTSPAHCGSWRRGQDRRRPGGRLRRG